MRKSFKGYMMLLAALCLIAVCVAAGVMASAAVWIDGSTIYSDGSYKYIVVNNEAKIVGAEESLTMEIDIPDTIDGKPVVSIGKYAFRHNDRITKVTIPYGIGFIEDEAFCACTALTEVIMSDSVLCINQDAFSGCTSLTDIVISDSVSLIDESVFENCTSLCEITIPASVTSIAREAFKGCSDLMRVVFEGQVQSIGESAFMGCVSLSEFTIPGSVTSIGDSAFRDCYCLTRVVYTGSRAQFNSLMPAIGSDNSELTDLRNWFIIYDFMELTILDANDGTVELFRADSDINGIAVIPGSVNGFTVVSIGHDSFSGCEQMTGIILQSSILHIWNGAFSDCPALDEVRYVGTAEQLLDIMIERDNDDFVNAHWYTIDQNEVMTEVFDKPEILPFGYFAVDDDEEGSYIIITEASTSLSGTLVIPGSIDGVPVRKISEGVFSDCQIESLYLSEGITDIDTFAFEGCSSLQTATIPSTMHRIGMAAFDECDALTTVYYGGTSAQAANINIDENNDPLTNATWFYGSTGTEYTVTYNANGGTGAPAAQTKVGGVALTLSSTAPTKKYTLTYKTNGGTVSPASKKVSCTFNGWNTAQNGSGTSYQAGGVYSSDSDATLYAQFSNPTAGSLATPEREGYSFVGWFTAADGGTQVTSSTRITKNTNIYAHWTESDDIAPFATVKCTGNIAVRQTVTVTTFDNAGIAGYYWGNSSNYANNTFTATSESQVSFYISKSGNFYLTVQDINGNVSETIKVVLCKTSFDANGGTISPKYMLTRQGSRIMLPVPTRAGYYFAGWYTAAEGGVKLSSYAKISTNSRIYAHWTATDELEPYGCVTSTNKVAVRQTVTLNLRDNVGVAGYYWGKNKTYTDNTFTAAGDGSVSFYVSQAGNYYLTIVDVNGLVSDTVQAVMCKTTFSVGGGTLSPKYALTLKNDTLTLPTPTRTGYRFDGWYTAAEGGTQLSPVIKVTKNSTIYAHWTQITD